MRFQDYEPGSFYDEYFEAPGRSRPFLKHILDSFETLADEDLESLRRAAERHLVNMGITFNVYGDERGADKAMPFDLLPRIVSGREWERLEAGLKQRATALNLFVADIYADQKIVADGVIPGEVIATAASYRPQCKGLIPPKGIWCHINGVDLVRDGSGRVFVLEDNLRCPSGVSYVIENREIMKRTFPQVFEGLRVRPVDGYPSELLATLEGIASEPADEPTVVVLTPGTLNSAYFEHAFLAMQMGVQLVEGRDLTVQDGYVKMRTTRGLVRVDVIYRRIDDDFLDPRAFRPDSMLGVPGLMEVFRNGRVAIANAPGTGVADDKVVYAYVPDMVRYYLDQDPLLPNVETYLGWREPDRDHMLKNLDRLVVKAANEAGGYGMLVGSRSTEAEREKFAALIRKNPRNYIAQPILDLSRVPTLCGETIEGRHVDLRPYVLYRGDDIYVVPGGLTRVALVKDSLVVNSSQGGGSKDTWIVDGVEA